jgi:hypothetical protein
MVDIDFLSPDLMNFQRLSPQVFVVGIMEPYPILVFTVEGVVLGCNLLPGLNSLSLPHWQHLSYHYTPWSWGRELT